MSRKAIKFEINPLLSGPSLEARNRSGSPYRVIPINDIDVDPDQPRRSFDAESIAELAASIEVYGLLCPILVRLTPGGTYRLVSGERRLRAHKSLGLESIAAIIDSEDDESSTILAKQLVENIQRTDLNPMEKAIGIGQMRDRFSLSIREIATKLGLSKSSVQRSLDLLSLPDDLQAALISGASESKVVALSKVTDISKRRKLLENLDKLSREELGEMINPVSVVSHGGTLAGEDGTLDGSTYDISNQERQTLRVGDSKTQISDQRIEETLRKALGLKVSIKRNPKALDKGRVVIDFYSASDLNEVYDRLEKSNSY